jgi:flagellar hook-basal body complex protein FliE
MAITSINDALAAYAAVSRAAKGDPQQGSDPAQSGATPSGPDFASLVTSGLKSAVETSQKSEMLSQQALAGKADIKDVVAAVNNAALTLQTVVAVRDRVINAYNQIMQMPI